MRPVVPTPDPRQRLRVSRLSVIARQRLSGRLSAPHHTEHIIPDYWGNACPTQSLSLPLLTLENLQTQNKPHGMSADLLYGRRSCGAAADLSDRRVELRLTAADEDAGAPGIVVAGAIYDGTDTAGELLGERECVM
jgi:hypothetical protein